MFISNAFLLFIRGIKSWQKNSTVDTIKRPYLPSFMYPSTDENKDWPLITVTPFASTSVCQYSTRSIPLQPC